MVAQLTLPALLSPISSQPTTLLTLAWPKDLTNSMLLGTWLVIVNSRRWRRFATGTGLPIKHPTVYSSSQWWRKLGSFHVFSYLTTSGYSDCRSSLPGNQWTKRLNLKFRNSCRLLLSSSLRIWTVCYTKVQTDNETTGLLCGEPNAIFHKQLCLNILRWKIKWIWQP